MATNGCAEISEHRAPLEAVQDALSKLSAGRHEFEEFLTELFDRWRDLREQCALLERERAMLQAQLEAAGRHHAGLAAALAAQQRRNARLQTRWTTEFDACAGCWRGKSRRSQRPANHCPPLP